jgi:hypothetical protein
MARWKSYRFAANEKDPVIHIAMRCVEIYAAMRNLPFTVAMRELEKSSGVSYSCMQNWFYGTTRMPYFDTVVRVVHATGREVSVDGHGMGSKARFKPTVIKGGKAA